MSMYMSLSARLCSWKIPRACINSCITFPSFSKQFGPFSFGGSKESIWAPPNFPTNDQHLWINFTRQKDQINPLFCSENAAASVLFTTCEYSPFGIHYRPNQQEILSFTIPWNELYARHIIYICDGFIYFHIIHCIWKQYVILLSSYFCYFLLLSFSTDIEYNIKIVLLRAYHTGR